ncbi:MAG: hypothetical protein MUF72_12695 [Elainella sp. Prado103]|jgi:hypothetical protein|nr:hypothetical protein [Elainella sp. Prado103]
MALRAFDMSLTAGTTLQNQKYIIQKLLHQSDFGSTYQALHAYLNQDVVLQTLNPVLRERQDFEQIRQQFFNTVRSIAQGSQATRVLDCFEEGNLPFVVFERVPGQSPPLLVDWFPLMPHTVNPLSTLPESPPSSAVLAAQTSSPEEVESAAATRIPSSEISPIPALVSPEQGELAKPAVTQAPTKSVLHWGKPARSDQPSHPPTIPVKQLLSPQFLKPYGLSPERPLPKHSKGWMPIAIISISMAGGLLGAGFGLSLRLSASRSNAQDLNQSGAPQTQPNPARISRLKPSLFSREQSFPPDQNWPISETPQFFNPDASPIEEPVYRVSPVEDYATPDWEPLPSAPIVPDPQLSAPTPSSVQVTTSPQPAPVPSPVVDPVLAPLPTPESAPAAVQPMTPEPAPPEPSLPVLPELPPVTPPAPAEPIPSAPAPDSAGNPPS